MPLIKRLNADLQISKSWIGRTRVLTNGSTRDGSPLIILNASRPPGSGGADDAVMTAAFCFDRHSVDPDPNSETGGREGLAIRVFLKPVNQRPFSQQLHLPCLSSRLIEPVGAPAGPSHPTFH
jgi:hypothetical protein